MTQYWSALSGIGLLLLSVIPSGAQPVKLFNGKNLDGWYKYLKTTGKDQDPLNVFTVSKGKLLISGEDYGCITTDKEYENYKLVVEYKWGERTFAPRVGNARDNGVLIHSQGADGAFGGSWMYSIECQVIEGGTGDFLVVADGSEAFAITCPVAPEKQGGSHVFQPEGQPVTIHKGRINWFGRDPEWKDVLNFRGKQDVEKRTGKWNRMEIVARGDGIDFFLNGVLVNQARQVKPAKGRIQIQSEGAEMLVRKVVLTPLE